MVGRGDDQSAVIFQHAVKLFKRGELIGEVLNSFLANQKIRKFILDRNSFGDIAEVARNTFFIKELRKKIEGMNGVAMV